MNRDKKQGAAPSENYIKYILEHGPVNPSLSAKNWKFALEIDMGSL